MWHKFLHFLGYTYGQVVTIRINGIEEYWIGHQCIKCGNISNITRSRTLNI